jgi:hypothetical protein
MIPSRTHRLDARSTRLAAGPAVALSLALLSGCIFVQRGDDAPSDPGPPNGYDSGDIAQVPIDEGGAMTVDPGEGAGLYVESLGGGDWYVWSTCDTEQSGYSCWFDLQLEGTGMRLVEGEDLEGYDDVVLERDRMLVTFETSVDVDGVSFRLDEREPLRLGAWLDDADATAFVFWVEDGAISQGMPTNPTDFVPR